MADRFRVPTYTDSHPERYQDYSALFRLGHPRPDDPQRLWQPFAPKPNDLFAGLRIWALLNVLPALRQCRRSDGIYPA